jgi:hypothetical protein
MKKYLETVRRSLTALRGGKAAKESSLQTLRPNGMQFWSIRAQTAISRLLLNCCF